MDTVMCYFVIACMVVWVALLIGKCFCCRVWDIRRRVEVWKWRTDDAPDLPPEVSCPLHLLQLREKRKHHLLEEEVSHMYLSYSSIVGIILHEWLA